MKQVEADYLVVGAGASGMAFVDALVAASDADVVMVDRRHRPGGHWNVDYPFVRLHQPSAYYGVNSRVLGYDSIDQTGDNAGFYERAGAAEICDYYQRMLDEQLVATGRVQFFGMCDYFFDRRDGHQFVNLLTGETTAVRVRRKVVDATYLESSVPATHTPSFQIEPGVRLVTPNDLVTGLEPASGYTVIGAGKTSMDTGTWLLVNGVPPEAIRWIRPRDAWTLDRRSWQPLSLLPYLMEGLAVEVEASAQAQDPADLFRRLEAAGHLVRLDPEVEPVTFRGAILSEAERQSLRRIANVVRRGRALRLGVDEIGLDGGVVRTDGGQVHVDCTAAGLNRAPVRPVFEVGRITPQALQWGVLPFSSALIGFIEASRRDDADKNRLCPPSPVADKAVGWIRRLYVTQRSQATWQREPDIAAWMKQARLNPVRGIRDHLDDPRMRAALDRYTANTEPALVNLRRLLTLT